MNFNELQKEKPSALSLNLTAWQALAQIGQQLQKLASAQMGEGNFCPLPPPVRTDGNGYGGHLTVVELVNEFLLAKARAGRSDRYLRALHNSLSKFIEGRARAPAWQVTVADVEKWMQRRAWAPRTQRGYLSDVRTMFNFAVRRGYMDRNPAAGVELPTLDQKPPQIHSPAQVRAVLEFAQRGPGEKILAIDELWLWVNARTMPRNFQLCTQAGSEYGVRILALTQEPHRVNSSIIGQTTELICFRLQEPKAWDCVKALGADVEAVKNLPLGSFISYNRLSGGSLAGRVF